MQNKFVFLSTIITMYYYNYYNLLQWRILIYLKTTSLVGHHTLLKLSLNVILSLKVSLFNNTFIRIDVGNQKKVVKCRVMPVKHEQRRWKNKTVNN